jgi:hypothetical protein
LNFNKLKAEPAPKLVRVHFNLRQSLRRKRSNPEYEDVHLLAIAIGPMIAGEEAAGDLIKDSEGDSD